MKAIIPCAGYATRLYPLTLKKPKSLLPIKGIPILNYIIDKVQEIPEIDEIAIVSNNKFFNNFIEWKSKSKFKIPVRILNDMTKSNSDRLGQIGDIYFAIKELETEQPILTIAGDNLFTFSLKDIYKYFKGKDIVNVLYDVKDISQARKYGVVAINKNGQFTDFIEKPENPKSTLSSIGITLFSKKGVKLIKKYIQANHNPDKMGYFFQAHYKTKPIYGYICNKKSNRWVDIGTLDQYEKVKDGV